MIIAQTNDDAAEKADVPQMAEKYRAARIGITRIRRGEKRPTDPGWTTRSAEPDEFEPDDSIGLMCGWISDGGVPGQCLVCLDIDDLVALALADEYLPLTLAIEGHPGKPRSHWYYFVTNVPEWAWSLAAAAVAAAKEAGRDPGPFLKHFRHKDTGKPLFDFIGTGGQVVAPPSLRADGNRREWEPGCDISKAAVIKFEDLWAAVIKYAEALGARIPDVGPDAPAAGGGEETETKEGKQSAEATERPASRPVRVPKARGRVDDVPMEERVRRCRKYLQTVDLPRSGHGGHDTTWTAARIIVNDFAVDDRELALGLLREYNSWAREAGEEPWDEAQLAHKVDDALRAPPNPRWSRGHKLFERSGDGEPRAWDDPERLATGFLATRTVKFVKDTTFEYVDGTYQVVSGEWLSARVREYVAWAAARECRRRRADQDRQRAELQATLSAPAPGPGAETGEHTLDAQRRADARKALAKLGKAKPITTPPVTQAMVATTIEAMRVEAQLPDGTKLDSWLDGRTGPGVLAVENGLLDPVSRTLTDHSPDWLSTAKLSVAYNPNAPAPAKWLAVLNELMEGDADRVAVIQEIFGACLDRGLKLKFFAGFVGAGDNGKSVVLAVLRCLLGEENCSSVNIDELSKERFAAYFLFGKLANIVGDQGHFLSADEGRLRALTGGDTVKFEQKGKDPFSGVNGAKIVFAANTMPTFADKSEAVWNRLIAVPFGFTVPKARKNPAMLDKAFWAEELPDILNWALEGLARLRKNNAFTESAKCAALKCQTRLDSNPARRFLEEEYEYTGNKDDKITVAELYKAYADWCASCGLKYPLVREAFGLQVKAVFPELSDSKPARLKDRDGTHRSWIGLRRREVTDVTEEATAA